MIAGIDDGPFYAGFYSQMKQEYASARFFFYEGRLADSPHYSDAGVVLYNTLDYPRYGLGAEKLRISFRMAYSLLDKIAFFLNHYLGLGIKPRQVSFRSLWYEKGRSENGIRAFFEQRRNHPLRGMFWLAKDLFEEGFQAALEPDARELKTMRDRLEHRYLKLHEGLAPGGETGVSIDPIAYSVSDVHFERRTERLLKMVRAAMIYLSLGVHMEEHQRRADLDPSVIVPGLALDVWDDSWKRRSHVAAWIWTSVDSVPLTLVGARTWERESARCPSSGAAKSVRAPG